ncbi:RteC domain-containing protein [Pseudotamlana carrageenivorans]|uniref:Tetracycline regulation of excision, RteC n=1 Tax=Pseudotamlana carrageenivorans TaxID=2069432 RepID=A0A2I7SJ89_9FLAO|nr:RteC domain-containing protein [Tamlana carrageenivorans]AUS05949.1 hypothetical protein C1A40_11020 [Tamlana carrageenivorans]
MELTIYKTITNLLNQKLEDIDQSNDDTIQKLERSYSVSYKALKELKQHYSNSNLLNQQKEIEFFKHIKPYVLSKVITFSQLYNLENRKPTISDKAILKYYKSYIVGLQDYIDSNISFYNYYRTESSMYDQQYFTRSEIDLKLYPEAAYFCTDNNFSTSHDTILATIMANEEIIMYVKQEMTNYSQQVLNSHKGFNNNLKWTATKSDLVELLYALHSSNAINNGNVTLKELATFLKEAFSLKLDDYSRVYYELQSRTQKTKFIDNLKETLENRIENSLETRR